MAGAQTKRRALPHSALQGVKLRKALPWGVSGQRRRSVWNAHLTMFNRVALLIGLRSCSVATVAVTGGITRCQESPSSDWWKLLKEHQRDAEDKLQKMKEDALASTDEQYAQYKKVFGEARQERREQAESFSSLAMKLQRTLDTVIAEMGDSPLPMDRMFAMIAARSRLINTL